MQNDTEMENSLCFLIQAVFFVALESTLPPQNDSKYENIHILEKFLLISLRHLKSV